jgi:Rhodopirellula transposase DDE domain
VRVHDFLIKELGRAVPYGIYDLAANTGWVNVGVSFVTRVGDIYCGAGYYK